MNRFLTHLAISWRLHLRNRMALVYGYLFPLIFLLVFWVLYRHDPVPLVRHLGELLTVTILGGACFGLPTTLVSERERGVWRRYRLTPVPTWRLVAGTVVARYLIILSAGLLQVAVAFAAGMTAPAHPWVLVGAFTVAALAFIGLGLLLAMLADNVPAVQALGQCVFLPMLVIGGVAVPLAGLPEWAQRLAGFFPGRYAVEAMQAATTGRDLSEVPFALLALTLTGLAGLIAGVKLFRWDAQQRFAARSGKGWIVVVLAAWLSVGALAEIRARAAVAQKSVAVAAPVVRVDTLAPWEKITASEVAALDYRVPPDEGVVTPFAAAGEEPDDFVAEQITQLRAGLPDWTPGALGDDVQRVRFLLCVAAVPDVAQEPAERYIPVVVFEHLQATWPKAKLIRLLTWIVQHPEDGAIASDISALGVTGAAGDPQMVRERSYFYAIKMIARLTGRQEF